MMDALEDKLRRLAPRGPSPELDRRVLNALAGVGKTEEGAGIQEEDGCELVEVGGAGAGGRGRTGSDYDYELRARDHCQGMRRVSVRWALAAALLMGLIGFFAGRNSRHGGGAPQTASAPAAASTPVTVNVIYTGSAPNPFDCTVAADDGLRPAPEIKIDSKPGV